MLRFLNYLFTKSAPLLVTIHILFGVSNAVFAKDVYDIILRGGTIYDGSGTAPIVGDVAISKDTIAAIGNLTDARGKRELIVEGKVVAPGFINILSWASESLLVDGLAQSDIRQGVTLEVFGEGWSMGPLTPAMKRAEMKSQGDLKYKIPWNTLSGYLNTLVKRGVSTNVASFIGATTIRIHELGYENRPPSNKELERMKKLVHREMQAGALGIGSSLIYAPAFYADTQELIELCKVAAEYGGMYISHIRSEGNQLLEAVDELIEISRKADIPAELYHLKAAGKNNWNKLDQVISKIENARADGLQITADMYTYTAGATGLNAAMPPWVQEGGFSRWQDRLRDPEIRKRVVEEMKTPTDQWENLLLMAGSADNALLVGFKNDRLKHLTGKTLGEIARQRGSTPEVTAMDLVIEDGSRVDCVYFMMSEENIKKKIALPWVSFGSDASALAPQGVFLKSNPHPRAYGCFSRLLGKYVRDEKVIPMQLAIHKLSGLPAKNLGIRRRGLLQVDYFADIVVFDPEKIQDHATYAQPHQYSTGMQHVFVNGKQVLRNGKHTGVKPGRVCWGPGKYRNRHKQKPLKMTPLAEEIHRTALLFDGHNDLPWAMRNKASSSFDKFDISQHQPELDTDIPRLRKGGVGAQFWSVYVPTDTSRKGTALLQTLEQIDLVYDMIKRYPKTFELAKNSTDIERIHKSGKIASLIGVEGGHSIEDSLQVLRQLYKRGTRYMTLTHSDTLSWADSATDKSKNQGLSSFGEEVVREMNRLGMLIDLSHVSVETMKDTLKISKAPVIFSHSSARSIAEHARNVPNDVLRLTAKNGGVVMVNFFSGFVVPSSAKNMSEMFNVSRRLRKEFTDDEQYAKALRRWRAANPIDAGTIHVVLDHIDHIARTAGVDHVGLGSDYDGVSSLPSQLTDVSYYPFITQGLLQRGYTRAEIHKILGGNALRALRRTEEVARKLQKN